MATLLALVGMTLSCLAGQQGTLTDSEVDEKIITALEDGDRALAIAVTKNEISRRREAGVSTAVIDSWHSELQSLPEITLEEEIVRQYFSYVSMRQAAAAARTVDVEPGGSTLMTEEQFYALFELYEPFAKQVGIKEQYTYLSVYAEWLHRVNTDERNPEGALKQSLEVKEQLKKIDCRATRPYLTACLAVGNRAELLGKRDAASLASHEVIEICKRFKEIECEDLLSIAWANRAFYERTELRGLTPEQIAIKRDEIHRLYELAMRFSPSPYKKAQIKLELALFLSSHDCERASILIDDLIQTLEPLTTDREPNRRNLSSTKRRALLSSAIVTRDCGDFPSAKARLKKLVGDVDKSFYPGSTASRQARQFFAAEHVRSRDWHRVREILEPCLEHELRRRKVSVANTDQLLSLRQRADQSGLFSAWLTAARESGSVDVGVIENVISWRAVLPAESRLKFLKNRTFQNNKSVFLGDSENLARLNLLVGISTLIERPIDPNDDQISNAKKLIKELEESAVDVNKMGGYFHQAPLKYIQDSLLPTDVLIELIAYAHTLPSSSPTQEKEFRLFAYVITKSGYKVVNLPGDCTPVWYQKAAFRWRETSDKDHFQTGHAAQEFYRKLWMPIEAATSELVDLNDVQRIFFSGPALQTDIPIEAIPISKKQLLIDRYRVARCRSGLLLRPELSAPQKLEVKANSDSVISLLSERGTAEESFRKHSYFSENFVGVDSREKLRDALDASEVSGTNILELVAHGENVIVGSERGYLGFACGAAFDGGLETVEPQFGSPSMRAGIRAGLKILEIDDQTVPQRQLNEEDVKRLLSFTHGMVGDDMTIAVQPRGGEITKVTIPREQAVMTENGRRFLRNDVPMWSAGGYPLLILRDDAFSGTSIAADALVNPVQFADIIRDRFRVVVLASCQSAVASTGRGESSFDFRDAALTAGADYVVACDQDVPASATFFLMQDFKKRVRSGEAPVKAFHAAQIETALRFPDSEDSPQTLLGLKRGRVELKEKEVPQPKSTRTKNRTSYSWSGLSISVN